MKVIFLPSLIPLCIMQTLCGFLISLPGMYVRVNTYLTQVGYCSVPCFFQCLRVFVKAQRAVLQRHFPSLVPGGLWFLPPRLCHLPDLPRCSLPSDAPPPPLSVWPVCWGIYSMWLLRWPTESSQIYQSEPLTLGIFKRAQQTVQLRCR